ncbi:NAD(P)-binding protein [Karstenula rhodostoma CBS 690.94]|uniref:NAD(P)-binding protein n=1 Tax=Karstenula rhodostoma CBS 690.94 TaxID=1392251 RepID=A0A9P4UBX7_9PLEO|nr:NAD(P)-binding protein [Karstenula rhodostoma CBS 690.94]
MSKPVALILGSGPRVGAAVAAKFASTGYSVAITSRKAAEGKSPDGYLSIKADLSNPSSVPAVFEAVKAEFKSAPSVIIYNAAALTPPTGDDLFSIPVESLNADLNTNTVSVYAAAKEAVKGWASLPGDSQKVFIYTGNKLNTWIAPMVLTATLGVGKRATSYLIGSADTRYAKEGYRFFYADERNADGSIKGMAIDGEAHADFFAQLASGEGEVPWNATFVKGQGYVKFE